MPKKSLPTLTQLNLHTAIANMQNLGDVLMGLLALPLPEQALKDITKAIALNEVAKSHLKLSESIATDLLMGNGRKK